MEFTTTQGYDWIYGDWRAGYNGPYPNGSYFSNGNFFAWLGENQGTGRIDFTGATANYLSVWTSTHSGLTMDAYDANDNWIDSSGWATNNLNTGKMTQLTVSAPNMAYVLIHDSGNYWLIDDLEIGDLLAETKSYLPENFSVIHESLETLNKNESIFYTFYNKIKQRIKIIFGFGGSEFSVRIYKPDGTLYNEYQSTIPPIIIDIQDAEPGEWQVEITAIDIPYDNYPVALVVGEPASDEGANQRPIANAGSDQESPVGADCLAYVTLDGFGSSDPDGDPLTYAWTWDGGSTTGVNPTIQLPLGVHTITLVVNDGEINSEPDTVEITVFDTITPVVQAMNPNSGQALQDSATFQAAASDNCGINSVSFFIREPSGSSGTPIGYENLISTLNTTSGKWEHSFDTTRLPDGYYILLAKALDNSGNEGWSAAVPFSIRNWAVLEMLPATKNDKAGRTMPVKFSLRIVGAVDPTMPFIYNEQLEIRIYSSSKPGNILQSSVFGDSSTDYRIDTGSEHYITNFRTDKKPAKYTVEIWRPSNNFLVGGFTFATTK